jgi:hypothetical protein
MYAGTYRGLLAQSFILLYIREGGLLSEHNSSPNPAKNRHRQPTLATLIPKDDILIFCESASKTALAKYAKPSKHATPQPHGCGVKGEPNRKQSGFRMTPRTNNSDAHKKYEKVFTKRQ